jgi:hypothetical protein
MGPEGPGNDRRAAQAVVDSLFVSGLRVEFFSPARSIPVYFSLEISKGRTIFWSYGTAPR